MSRSCLTVLTKARSKSDGNIRESKGASFVGDPKDDKFVVREIAKGDLEFSEACESEALHSFRAQCKHGSHELIRAACDYYFDDVEFQVDLESWAQSRAGPFSPLDTEYSLVQTSIFEDFKAFFELKIACFLKKLGYSSEDLYDAIRYDTSRDFYSGRGAFHNNLIKSYHLHFYLAGSTLVTVINASTDFKTFHTMMVTS